jgi:hypothetical protein
MGSSPGTVSFIFLQDISAACFQFSESTLLRTQRCCSAAALLGGEIIGEYRGEPLYHGSLDGVEYRELLDHNGFAIVSHVVEDITCGRHTIWLAQLR